MSAIVEAIARAWMKHQGYTEAEVLEAETQECTEECRSDGGPLAGGGILRHCWDEDGNSRHPLRDELSSACEFANVAIEAIESIGIPLPEPEVQS